MCHPKNAGQNHNKDDYEIQIVQLCLNDYNKSKFHSRRNLTADEIRKILLTIRFTETFCFPLLSINVTIKTYGTA